ncbi:hypothetical protein PV327_011431, partial [Microctonus hyperodae]
MERRRTTSENNSTFPTIKVFAPHYNGLLPPNFARTSLQYQKLQNEYYRVSIHDCDNTFILKNEMIAVVRDIVAINDEYLLKIAMFLRAALSRDMFVIDLEQIERKCFRMPYWDSVYPNSEDEPVPGKFHIVAALFFCNRFNVAGLKLLSGTDIECLWKKQKEPVLEQFKALPMKTFCCVFPKRLPPLSDSIPLMCRMRLIACDPNTGIAKSSTRKRLTKQPNLNNTFNVIQQKDFTAEIVQNVCNSPLSTNMLNNFTMELKDCCKKVYNEYVIRPLGRKGTKPEGFPLDFENGIRGFEEIGDEEYNAV